MEVRLRVDDLERGTQHGATVPLEETAERVATILRHPGSASENPSARAAPTMVTSPPTTVPELRRALAAVVRAPQEELPGVARNLVLASPEVWPELLASLETPLKHSKRNYKAVLDVIGGDVPNRYGHFARTWKRRHGYSVKLSTDWIPDLLALPEAQITRTLRPMYRDLLLRSLSLHAAAHIGRAEHDLGPAVVDALLDAAYAKDGVFRDEVSRAFDALGDPAVPQLMRRSRLPTEDPERAGELGVRQAKYARFVLDRLDRWIPSRGVNPLRADPALLANLFRAYGEVLHGEAAELLLEFSDDDTPALRDAARGAFRALVTGRAATRKRRSLRLLGGRRSSERAELTYRGHAMSALRSALEGIAPETIEADPPCTDRREDGTLDLLCTQRPSRLFGALLHAYDARRTERAQQVLAESDALQDTEPTHALAKLDGLVSVGAHLYVGEQLAERFTQVADRFEREGQRAAAAELLRKAAFFLHTTHPERAKTLRARALRHEASLPGIQPEGRAMLERAAAMADNVPHDAAQASPLIEAGRIRDTHTWSTTALLLLGLLTLAGGRMLAREESDSAPA